MNNKEKKYKDLFILKENVKKNIFKYTTYTLNHITQTLHCFTNTYIPKEYLNDTQLENTTATEVRK